MKIYRFTICLITISLLCSPTRARAEEALAKPASSEAELAVINKFKEIAKLISDGSQPQDKKLKVFVDDADNSLIAVQAQMISRLTESPPVVSGWAAVDGDFAVVAVVEGGKVGVVDLDPIFLMKKSGEWKMFTALTSWRGHKVTVEAEEALGKLKAQFREMKNAKKQ